MRLKTILLIDRASPEEVADSLQELFDQNTINQIEISFGEIRDPLLPFEENFQDTFRILEILSYYHPARVRIETRSPLIILAAPILKALGKSLSVHIPVEDLNDKQTLEYLPRLPRPSEREAAAKTLKALGIRTFVRSIPVEKQKEAA